MRISSAASGWRRSTGQYFDNISPITGQAICEVARSDARGHREGARRGPCGQGRLGPHQPRRARPYPQQDRRPDRGETQLARRSRDVGTTASRSARSSLADMPLDRRSLPLFRRLYPRAGRQRRRDRPRHRRLSLPRAAGRGRPDHPLELPDPDGGVEARPGARRRQLRRPQAGRADARRASWCCWN